MRLSARNQLNAIIDSVQLGEVMATVKVTLPDLQHLKAATTCDSVQDLDLASGDQVKVITETFEKTAQHQVGRLDWLCLRSRGGAGSVWRHHLPDRQIDHRPIQMRRGMMR